MKKSPRIATIIPVYNCKEYLSAAIDSCLNQVEPGDQVVVVNDGSPESLVEIEEKYKNNGNVLWINQENTGVSVARNNGVAQCDADFIRFMDADDEMFPGTLGKFRDFIASNDQVDILFSDYYVEPIKGFRVLYSEIKSLDEFLVHQAGSGQNDDFILLSDTFGREYSAGNISQTCIHPIVLTIRKSLFEALDGFDASLKIGEDIDFSKRAVLRGQVGYIKNAPCAIYFKWRGDFEKYIIEYQRTRDVHLDKINNYGSRKEYWNSKKVLAKNELCLLFWRHPSNFKTKEILSFVGRSFLYFPMPMQQIKYFLSIFVPRFLWSFVLRARYRYF
jgi:glycosyltransferase involved in cell wall biosynthesis